MPINLCGVFVFAFVSISSTAGCLANEFSKFVCANSSFACVYSVTDIFASVFAALMSGYWKFSDAFIFSRSFFEAFAGFEGCVGGEVRFCFSVFTVLFSFCGSMMFISRRSSVFIGFDSMSRADWSFFVWARP